MGLSVKRVEKLLRAGVRGRHTDGDVKGLMLCVESKTSAAWSLRWQRDHKTHQMGLGSARPGSSSYLSLAAAREKAREQYERLARGIDPLERKRQEREAQRQAEATRHTFRQAAQACHAALEPGWSSSHHSDEFISSLERYAFPIIGSHDIGTITKDEVLRVLEQKLPSRIKGADGGVFWSTKAITASRVRERIQRVIDFATVRGWRTGDNPARWKSFLDQVLAAPRSIRPVQNMRAVPYSEVPAVMAALAADQGNVAAQCLRFIIMTSCRLGEALKATWDEIDLQAAEWTIPASRMKARREHRVPLSREAVELLHSLYREEGNPYLFISSRTAGAHVVESTVGIALRDAGRSETVHGFRASFKTWAEESTSFPGLVIELSLAHAPGSLVERSYRRGDVIVKRRRLMESWSKFVCTPPVASEKNVLTMRGAAR
jgi:integrase